MTNEIKGGGSNVRANVELSEDINVITAEINAYQRVAGEAIFEIGRRLKHVKENDLAHGEFGKWLESVSIDWSVANKMMKIVEEIGESYSDTYTNLGMNALYQIATLPPEEREVEHTTSKGETKKPDEMTVKELRELKRQLKETEKQAEAERKERERLEVENEKLSNREPEVITEYIEKETSEPYDRRMDEPYSVERGRDFYEMMNEVDTLYKKYAHLKDGIEELRGIAEYDEDLKLKYRKADEFWRMLGEIFSGSNNDIIDVEII